MTVDQSSLDTVLVTDIAKYVNEAYPNEPLWKQVLRYKTIEAYSKYKKEKK